MGENADSALVSTKHRSTCTAFSEEDSEGRDSAIDIPFSEFPSETDYIDLV